MRSCVIINRTTGPSNQNSAFRRRHPPSFVFSFFRCNKASFDVRRPHQTNTSTNILFFYNRFFQSNYQAIQDHSSLRIHQYWIPFCRSDLGRTSSNHSSLKASLPSRLSRHSISHWKMLLQSKAMMRRENILRSQKTSQPSSIARPAKRVAQRRNYFDARDPVRPYSDSLPSPGYEWCDRCQIRTHKFQKPQGQHNACLDTPRFFGLGVCTPARKYYQQQVTNMIFLSLFCFAAAPLYNATQNADDERTIED